MSDEEVSLKETCDEETTRISSIENGDHSLAPGVGLEILLDVQVVSGSDKTSPRNEDGTQRLAHAGRVSSSTCARAHSLSNGTNDSTPDENYIYASKGDVEDLRAELNAECDEMKSLLEDQAEEGRLLPDDTYSFLAICTYFNGCCKPTRPFLMAVNVFMFQTGILILLAIDIVDLKNSDNPLHIPGNVSYQVRVGQMIALYVTVLTQKEVAKSLNVIWIGYDGEYLTSCESHPNAENVNTSRTKWRISWVSRLLVGFLALAVTFMLVITSDSVRDLLLNFTAIEFVSNVANASFMLCHWGYDSSLLRDATKDVKKVKSKEEGRRKQNLRYFIFAATSGIFVGFWMWISMRQANGYYLPQTIYVQFGDEYSPELGTFSGLYNRQKSSFDIFGDLTGYVANGHGTWGGSAKFGYCAKERAWTFTYGDRPSHSPYYLCDDNWIRVTSGETTSFNIMDAASGAWFYQDTESNAQLPLQHFAMSARKTYYGMECPHDKACRESFACKNAACGERFVCHERKCVCETGWYGLSCRFPEPCAKVEIDERRGNFTDSNHTWSSSFVLAKNKMTNTTAQVYGRPVYISTGENHNGPYDIIMYTGRRWTLTHTGLLTDLLEMDVTELNQSVIADYVTNKFHAHWSTYSIAFVSEPVDVDTPQDAATPVGLKWFQATAPHRGGYSTLMQSVDENHESSAVLLCAI